MLLFFKHILFTNIYYIIIIILLYIFNIDEIESKHIDIHPQSVLDIEKDWYRYVDNRTSHNGHDAWDIKELNYFKSDEIFYAKLWLKNLTSLDNDPPFPLIQYGVQIDADSNRNTGDQGIEYDLIIKWDNKSKNWKKQYIQRSNFGDTIVLYDEELNNDEFRDGNTVNIIMNMSYFNVPDKYKIFFYAYGLKNEIGAPETIDFLGWTYIPPPNFKLTLIPEKIDQISFKETETIQVIAESNIDLPAKVKINAKEGYQSDSNLFNFNVKNNKEIDIIPKYGR